MPPSDAKSADYKSAAPPADAPARARRQSEGGAAPIIPDTCNLGIVLRTLVPLNVIGVLVALAATAGAVDAVNRFLAIAVILEPVALGSLVALCLARKVVNGMPLPVQWGVAIGVPAVLAAAAALVVQRFAAPELEAGDVAWWVGSRIAVAAAAARADAAGDEE